MCDRGPSDPSSDTVPPLAERVSALSEQLREMAARLEAQKAQGDEVDRSRVRQLRGIVACQEEERGRMARELREHLGQQLTALQLTVEANGTRAESQPQRFEEIRKTLGMIADIGRGLDAVALELRPAALDEFGLSAVLRDYVQQWSRHAAIRGSFHSGPSDGERFLPEVEATLYRIARTALDTADRAGANCVDVRLERRGANAVLVVEIDIVAATERGDTTACAQMRERAAALGGSVEIEPTPAGGCAIRAQVPLISSFSGPPATEGRQNGASHPATVDLLQTRLAELHTAVAARDAFVATLAHELRNPVAPLIFQIRLAIEKTEQMAGAQEHVPAEWARREFHRVEQRLHRLLETLDRLLDVSRLSTGRVDLQPEPVDLACAVREIVSSFEAELGLAHCSLTVEQRVAPTGSWDPTRLEQICRNLLSNAIRFGAGKPIEVTIDGDTDLAILQVRDHGTGIAPDQQSRVFERFERGAEQRSGGFGLGLWVVRNICAAMGGAVSVESTVGDGACFTVMLPRGVPVGPDVH